MLKSSVFAEGNFANLGAQLKKIENCGVLSIEIGGFIGESVFLESKIMNTVWATVRFWALLAYLTEPNRAL